MNKDQLIDTRRGNIKILNLDVGEEDTEAEPLAPAWSRHPLPPTAQLLIQGLAASGWPWEDNKLTFSALLSTNGQ